MLNTLLFFLLSFFALLNTFFFHDVSFAEGISFFSISIYSAAVITFYPSGVATLLKIYFLFSYLFFGIVPVVELHFGKIYWGGDQFSSWQYLYVSLIVMFLNIVVLLAYCITSSKKLACDSIEVVDKSVKLSDMHAILLLFISIFCFIIVLFVNDFSVISLLFRGGDFVQRIGLGTGPLRLVYESTLRFIPLTTAIVLLLKVRGRYGLKVIILIIGIICAFPTGIPRLRVPAFYFPLLFIFFPASLYRNRLIILLSFGILFIFPFLDNFRNFTSDRKLNLSIDYSYLIAGHFDAFQNLVRIVDINFVSYGQQLLGSLLFFVPRQFWPNKPIGTGHQLAEEADYNFSNISATWYAEGWANLGFLGAVLFAILIGCFMARLDRLFWMGQASDFLKILYLFFLGYMFFLLRGDLLSGFSYLAGAVVAILIPYLIVRSSKSNNMP